MPIVCVETTGKPSTPELEEILEQEGILLQQGQTAEVNVAAGIGSSR